METSPLPAVKTPDLRVNTVVLFLTGGLVGVLAYYGTVTPFVWVLTVLLGLWAARHLPRSGAVWRFAATIVVLACSAGVLGTIAYFGAVQWTPLFVGGCLLALVLAPDSSESDAQDRNSV